jgi:hypothetical protein
MIPQTKPPSPFGMVPPPLRTASHYAPWHLAPFYLHRIASPLPCPASHPAPCTAPPPSSSLLCFLPHRPPLPLPFSPPHHFTWAGPSMRDQVLATPSRHKEKTLQSARTRPRTHRERSPSPLPRHPRVKRRRDSSTSPPHSGHRLLRPQRA